MREAIFEPDEIRPTKIHSETIQQPESPEQELARYKAENIQLKEKLSQETVRANNAEDRANKAENLAMTDLLTELPNRRFVEATLERQLAVVSRGKYGNLAVIFIDVDNFKHINDTYGHSQGDRVLIELGQALNSQLRSTDTLGRYGGDEFIATIEMDEQTEENMEDILQRYLAAAQTVNTTDNADNFIGQTISIGCAIILRSNNISLADAINAADEDVFVTKEKGRNGFTISILTEGENTVIHAGIPEEKPPL